MIGIKHTPDPKNVLKYEGTYIYNPKFLSSKRTYGQSSQLLRIPKLLSDKSTGIVASTLDFDDDSKFPATCVRTAVGPSLSFFLFGIEIESLRWKALLCKRKVKTSSSLD